MAAHKGNSKGNGLEGMSSEKPVYVTGGIATPVVGFSNGVMGEPPKPKMRMSPKPVGDSSGLPMGEARKGGSYINPFGFTNAGGKKK